MKPKVYTACAEFESSHETLHMHLWKTHTEQNLHSPAFAKLEMSHEYQEAYSYVFKAYNDHTATIG